MRPTCPDCGEYPVAHGSEWFSAVLDSGITAITAPFEGLASRFESVFFRFPWNGAALPFFRILAALRIGTITDDVDARDTHRDQLVWEAAKTRGIALREFRLLDRHDGVHFFVARLGKKVRAFEGLPRPDRRPSKSLAWMDNKAILKKKFTAAGIPMARGRACITWTQAMKTFREVGAPVITKPHIGSRSRHTAVHITDEAELKAGFAKAKQLSPAVIVEQELRGSLFRITLINKKPAAIIRREPPHVTGDGTRTVRELAKEENKNPKRQGPTFHPLQFGETAAQELTRQGLSWDSVPEKGRMVTLGSYISRFYGGSTTDFTDRAHPDNLALFKHIGETLDDSLVGVDFIVQDMERSWREQELCGVIECNSLPNIDLHHDVLYGRNRDIAGMLMEIAFPGTI